VSGFLATCPHCAANLTDGVTSRVVGVEQPAVYDGVLYWACLDCGGRWHRFPEGHYLRARAERYVLGVRS
jgi:RNase P subunit RPR2